MSTLLTWLGFNDIENMRQNQPAAIATIVLQKNIPFERIVILTTQWDDKVTQQYVKWLKIMAQQKHKSTPEVDVITADVVSPIDFASITHFMQRILPKATAKSDSVTINLTSGTPTMATVSVLIGKSFSQCQFVQTTPEGQLINVDIPIDFAQEYRQSSNVALQQQFDHLPPFASAFEHLKGKSPSMLRAVEQANRFAQTDLPVLIQGNSGTGKELMAKAIHHASLRANKAFCPVNCGALPENLVDSILFGHVQGAFTGAHKEHKGLFEQADGGTLFLDEVGELPLTVQVKLLRALQQQEIMRVGDTKTISINVRIIAATHRNLLQMVPNGQFREDLFYRLAVGVVEIPALAERQEDIPQLINDLLIEINQQLAIHPQFNSKIICKNAIKFATEYSWPGNIRELYNTLQRAALWSNSDEITQSDLAEAIITFVSSDGSNSSFSLPGNLEQHIENVKKYYVAQALKKTNNNKSSSAKMLGLRNHQTLSNWMKNLGINA